MIRIVLTLVLAAGSYGCFAAPLLIGEGSYDEPEGFQSISVVGDELAFRQSSETDADRRQTILRYKYKVGSSGEIHVLASSNDNYFVHYILPYRWTWRGSTIIREARESGKVVVFTLRD